jgi:hypothetical protein
MKTWTAAIRDIQDIPEKVVRGTLISLSSRIIKRSPVDSGRFRGNWQATIGSPASGQLSSIDTNGSATAANAANMANRLEAGSIFYLTNNLPYGERLEYGYSKQAPSGMVRITLAEYEKILRLEASKA